MKNWQLAREKKSLAATKKKNKWEKLWFWEKKKFTESENREKIRVVVICSYLFFLLDFLFLIFEVCKSSILSYELLIYMWFALA